MTEWNRQTVVELLLLDDDLDVALYASFTRIVPRNDPAS
jgi:hypothetical protein